MKTKILILFALLAFTMSCSKQDQLIDDIAKSEIIDVKVFENSNKNDCPYPGYILDQQSVIGDDGEIYIWTTTCYGSLIVVTVTTFSDIAHDIGAGHIPPPPPPPPGGNIRSLDIPGYEQNYIYSTLKYQDDYLILSRLSNGIPIAELYHDLDGDTHYTFVGTLSF